MAEKEEKKPEEKKEEKPAPKDNLVVTQHTVRIGGKEIKYTVTAGTMILKEETPDREKEAEGEKPRAQVFFVAYTKVAFSPIYCRIHTCFHPPACSNLVLSIK